jgi:hypothetical protein
MQKEDQTKITIRFRKQDLKTLQQIDRISNEFNISRTAAITKVFNYLYQIDSSLHNPLIISPSFTEH